MDEHDTFRARLEAVLGEAPCACAIFGSASAPGTRSAEVDLIVLASRGPLRGRVAEAQETPGLDLFVETEASLTAELEHPRRAALIRGLAGARIVYDPAGILLAARTAAANLLRTGPQAHPFEGARAYEPVVDLQRKYRSTPSGKRSIVRAALVTALGTALIVRYRLWPVPVVEIPDALAAVDERVAQQYTSAAAGDDAALDVLAARIIAELPPIRFWAVT